MASYQSTYPTALTGVGILYSYNPSKILLIIEKIPKDLSENFTVLGKLFFRDFITSGNYRTF